MKLFVVFGFVALSVGEVSVIPGDNSHYVEGESRYIWMPDEDGTPHLVDLQAPVEKYILNERSGVNNEYWLYTRQNPHIYQLLIHGNTSSIWDSNYDATKPTKIIVHGWKNDGNTEMNPLITKAFLTVLDCNVIVVDWSTVADSLYTTATAGTPTVGESLGNFLVWLVDRVGGNWDTMHLVGFSLGAHVVGNAGRIAGGRAARITGLDPASPSWTNNKYALKANDSQYVEVIHTDGGMLGLLDPVGDADFYPNGGKNPQPGCWVSTCSHGRASKLFAATVYHNHLVGRLCSNIMEAIYESCLGDALNMGNGFISKYGNGIYGLPTGDTWPFNNSEMELN